MTDEAHMTDEAFVFPTSFAQERLWFLDQLVPDSAFYNIHTSVCVSMAVNREVLERSLNEIVRRHETLRTTFKTVDGQPVQVVAQTFHLRLRFVDLSAWAHSDREFEAVRLATEESQQSFDLASGPLLRTTLLRLGKQNYIFLLTMHHIIADGWSMGVLFQELSDIYTAFCAHRRSPLPDLAIQYADFAVWQKNWLRGEVIDEQLAYWKQQLQDLPVLKLPTDWPRPAVQSFEGAVSTFWLPEPLYSALVELSQKEAATLFMTMLAAFQTLLYRYSGQEDIPVGTPVANRNRAELEDLIGFFVNTLVLRTNLSGDPTFRTLLARVREVALDGYSHQDLPFEKLVQELHPERDMSRNPLFQVNFQLFNEMGSLEEPGPFDGESLEIEKGTANFDLALDLWEYPDGLWGTLEYSTDLFRAETIERMVTHFRILLEGIVADPEQRLSELPLLPKRERRQLLDWNKTDTEFSSDKCLHQLFEAQAQRTPNAIALSFRQQHLTYRELDRRTNQLAHYLQARGVGPDVVVAICVERSMEMVIGVLGILKAGGAYLPLDPTYPKERLAFMLQDAQTPLLLTQQKIVESLPAGSPTHAFLDTDWEVIDSCSESPPKSTVRPDNLSYVIYTSGSTGKPKGVMVAHRAVRNHLLWMQTAFPLTEQDRVPQKYPFNFDASICEMFCPLLAGSRLIVAEPAERWDISQFIQLLHEEQITVLDLVPSMLDALLEDPRFQACRSLRRIICGGEGLSGATRDRVFEQLNVELNNIYGPTEATIGSTSWTCSREESGPRVPIGRPIANTQVYVLDPHLNPVPIGVPGELYIGGHGLARGYLNRPDLTAEKFVHNPFSDQPGARLYKTGDIARHLPDGHLECLGRVDQQVKVRGYRIELDEIESTLAQHPSVHTCAVLAREDIAEQTKLVAYVCPVADEPELWPSLGEYAVYDDLLYHAMTHDEGRNRTYRNAISRVVKGKTAVDIGTGADAVLARFCADAGAERVYAIEVSEDGYRRARELVERLGLGTRIVLIHGDSRHVQLPEKVDVCVSEILGTIGSSEGVASILNDARRFMKQDGIMIPQRCVTKIAAISLPDKLATHPRLAELPRHYVEEVFKSVGHPFDLRMCIKSFPQANLLSAAQVFEDLNLAGCIDVEFDSQVSFTIRRKSRLDGFLLWLNLHVSDGEVIDSLSNQHNWLPVFFPAFCPGQDVSEGDVINAVCSCRLSEDGRMPEYTIAGFLNRDGAEPIAFRHISSYRTTAFKDNAFYESLFAGVDAHAASFEPNAQTWSSNSDEKGRVLPRAPVAGTARGLVPTLRSFLQQQLPEYMVPSAFVVLDALPLTANGKVDRQSLPAPGHGRPDLEAAYVAPRKRAEELLVEIWSELLGIERIGIYDNFFDLGGDSILSIQIIARANQAGLRLRPAQLFQHQTIAELAAVADTTPLIQAEQGIVTGSVPLTPVQHWFFEQDLADSHYYNQSVLLETLPSTAGSKLNAVFNCLVQHHDALRLRFVRDASGWQQTFGAPDESVPLSRFDLSSLSAPERTAAVERTAVELQAGLNLSQGPLLQAALFDFGHDEPGRLLIIAHHLVIDGVSWRILLEDLWTAYDQLVEGKEIRLPPKTTSFQFWAQRLTAYADTATLREEAAYWLSVPGAAALARLPRDYPRSENTVASLHTVTFSLSVDETRTLLQKVPKAYHTQINDVLLTALVQALADWTGQRSVVIDLEGHGREMISEDVDVSRTLGWFTTIFPVWLDLGSASDVGDVLKSVKEQLRRIPNRGIGYGLLRYLSSDEQIVRRLKDAPQPEVSFNYLGQFGQSHESSALEAAEQPTGSNLSPRGQRRYLLEIDGGVYEGRLEIDWAYCKNIHARSTIERLVENFGAQLRTLIAHCSAPGVGGYTPSDFSAARVSQEDLEKLLERLG
jgi:amino acid adenylation domain-containing protein/non-ribosomal peptide synthase protein (TIGR01720 family)